MRILDLAPFHFRSATTLVTLAAAAGLFSACTSTQPETVQAATQKRSKEHFSEAEYGVKASPRIMAAKSNLPRGGGREQIGKPYKVRGKVYHPKEDENYKKTGLASWYGDAFHGRLTANGEVYDMTHLTAAHPTMPLPSYARVTNLENGSSVMVRVNDRGPFSKNRLIDLSKRAAEMLDYTHSGVAKVEVEYVGRAPLHGQDDAYLIASYRPSNNGSDPSDGLPSGVMVAMNGPTPTSAGPAPGFPGELGGEDTLPLPTLGPVAPERPAFDDRGGAKIALASLSYAQEGGGFDQSAFSSFDRLNAAAVMQSWKRMNEEASSSSQPYVAAASFTDAGEADRMAAVLAPYGSVTIEKSAIDGTMWYGVNLRSDGRSSVDDLLQAAWASGAGDAIAVRD